MSQPGSLTTCALCVRFVQPNASGASAFCAACAGALAQAGWHPAGRAEPDGWRLRCPVRCASRGLGLLYGARRVTRSGLAQPLEALLEGAAQRAGALRHPTFLTPAGWGLANGFPWVVFEHVPWPSLADRALVCGPAPLAHTARWGSAGAAALQRAAALDREGLGLTPTQVLVDDAGQARTTGLTVDQALATVSGPGPGTGGGGDGGSPSALERLAFLAPELLDDAGSGTSASDVYTFGALLHLALTGSAPFSATTVRGLLLAVLQNQPAVDLERARPYLPRSLVALLGRTLALKPKDRPTLDQLLSALGSHAVAKA